MSLDIDIFFNSGMPLEATAGQIAVLFEIPFELKNDPPRFEYNGLDLYVLLYDEHGLVDDGTLLFTRYRYKLSIVNRYQRAPYAYEMREYVARYMFQRLVDVYKFPAMLVEDVQRLLDQWGDPEAIPDIEAHSMKKTQNSP